jgi:exodeoxyribonuclease VII small subunit
MKEQKENYSQAIKRLEQIVEKIERDELDIDELADRIKEANEIIAFCSEKLTKADREIEKIKRERNGSEE